MNYHWKGKQSQWQIKKITTGNSPNSYATTAGGVQETELNIQTKYCLANCENFIKIINGQCQWGGHITADVCMKFH